MSFRASQSKSISKWEIETKIHPEEPIVIGHCRYYAYLIMLEASHKQ